MRYSLIYKGFKVSFKVGARKTFWNWKFEVGFNSNRKVERFGEYGSSVRTNRPSPPLNKWFRSIMLELKGEK